MERPHAIVTVATAPILECRLDGGWALASAERAGRDKAAEETAVIVLVHALVKP